MNLFIETPQVMKTPQVKLIIFFVLKLLLKSFNTRNIILKVLLLYLKRKYYS